MFKNSLVLGKMYPPTIGHLYLIDTAISQSDHTHVIITHNDSQSIPGEVRYQALKSIYQHNPNVTIYSVSDEGLPQHDNVILQSILGVKDLIFNSDGGGTSFGNTLK